MNPVKYFRPNQVTFLSTDLRDGSQTPGINFHHAERVLIAQHLADAGIDVIEAGFPISSKTHNTSVTEIAKTVGVLQNAPVIAGFARTGRFDKAGQFLTEDIDAAWDAIRFARFPRIHIVGTGSDLHLREKYRSEGTNGRSRADNLKIVEKSIRHAENLMVSHGFEPDIEFSPEDCGRADLDYLTLLFTQVIDAGATTLNVPDTVGRMRPEQYGHMLGALINNVPGGQTVRWSTHTHDDLGLATANALAGVQSGARQVEGTFLGIGERAGNTCLEQIITIIGLYGMTEMGVSTDFQLARMQTVSAHISRLSNTSICATAPVVGKNAFRHKSGMHQDGILKSPEVYQDIPPERVGRRIELELGPDSGRAGLFYCAEQLGYTIAPKEQNRVYAAFKILADQIGLVEDEDLSSLLNQVLATPPQQSIHVQKDLNLKVKPANIRV
ncbi:MAG: hypothetical protein V3V13_02600 [Paracoccaceae bacterium]